MYRQTPHMFYYCCTIKLVIKRTLLQEREKLVLTRVVVFEVVQALKFKTSIPDENFLMLINFILQVQSQLSCILFPYKCYTQRVQTMICLGIFRYTKMYFKHLVVGSILLGNSISKTFAWMCRDREGTWNNYYVFSFVKESKLQFINYNFN